MTNLDIKQVAQQSKQGMQQANDITLASFSIPGLGNEQKLLGQAFSLNNGETSIPIIGERGVYVIMVENKIVQENVVLNEGTRSVLMNAFNGRANYEPFVAMQANSTIVDNRYTFF